jgi:hypothetical protein
MFSRVAQPICYILLNDACPISPCYFSLGAKRSVTRTEHPSNPFVTFIVFLLSEFSDRVITSVSKIKLYIYLSKMRLASGSFIG